MPTIPALITKMEILVPISGGIGFVTMTAKDGETGNVFVVSQETNLADTNLAISELAGAIEFAGYNPINLSDLP